MFSFSLAQSFAIYFRTFSILDSTQKISFVTDSRKYRFSFSISSTPRRSEEKIAEKMVDFFVVGFDELRWCVLIHFEAERWAAVLALSFPHPHSPDMQKNLSRTSVVNGQKIHHKSLNRSILVFFTFKISFCCYQQCHHLKEKSGKRFLIFRMKLLK